MSDFETLSGNSEILQRAVALARNQVLRSSAPTETEIYQYPDRLLVWLDETVEACQRPTARLERVAGWILDNDYQLRRAVRQIRQDLPRGFYSRLPALAESAGLPRVVLIVRAIINENQLQLSLSRLIQFVNSYQSVTTLCQAELWAIPPLVRQYCLDILVSAIGDLDESIELPFDSIDSLLNIKIETKNPANGFSVDSLNAIDQVTRAVTALGVLDKIDWYKFVDKTSCLDARLALDPIGVYARMDRATRSRYCHEVETISRQTDYSELQVAQKAIDLAINCGDVERHVGYWIVGAGRRQLELALDYRVGLQDRWRRYLGCHAGGLYAIAVVVCMVLFLLIPGWYLVQHTSVLLLQLLVLLISLFPASVIALSFINWMVTRFTSPDELPGLDPALGLPEDAETAVVVPVILKSEDEVRDVIERLELRQLANPEPGICYVLLSDPADADVEFRIEDEAIEKALVEGIRALNARYPEIQADRFLLLHRRREYNESEACWMAYERKRGKLVQFCELIVEGWKEPFMLTEGAFERLSQVRYLISLDADTMLTPGSAVRMVCKIAHPLNQPVFDPVSGRVTSGYTVLQPRIETLMRGESASLFAQLFSGESAIDIYSRAVSDVYQDLFGIGSYVGKGIVNVEAFHRSLCNRVPDNSILSHDLFEGMHGRVALITDIVLYENYPETWPEYAARQHRWIRGDWQLLNWIGMSVPVVSDRRAESVFTLLDRWRIIDNLRRSLVPVAMLAYFLGGWFMFPGNPLVWTILAVGAFAPYLMNEAFASLAQLSRREKPRGFMHRGRMLLARWAVSIAFLVTDAVISLDAVARTLWRVYVSHRNLLQWQSSAHKQLSLTDQSQTHSVWRIIWPSPLLAVFVAIGLFWYEKSTLPVAAPLLIAWLFAPLLAIVLGKSREFRRDVLGADDRQFLRRAARRTWHYFDTFCTPEENWLPPDNFQSFPGPVLAHRTSPTNIGLYLTSTLAARDLGYIGTREISIRTRNVLDALDRMQTHRGHILNWYDTRTLEPLEPKYISTVDSGNLAVCLIAVKQACAGEVRFSLCDEVTIGGLSDTLHVLVNTLHQLEFAVSVDLIKAIENIERRLGEMCGPNNYATLQGLLRSDWPLLEHLIADELVDIDMSQTDILSEIHSWLERFDHQLRSVVRDIDEFQPWLGLVASAPDNCQKIAVNTGLQLSPASSFECQGESVKTIYEEIKLALDDQYIGSIEVDWCNELKASLKNGFEAQTQLDSDLKSLAKRAHKLAYGMDFSWLYDQSCKLFHIGYNLTSGVLDANLYDLIASEARIASYFAIAKHDVPLEHWFYLGRPIVHLEGQPAVQSWNGSMFEYLMPPLFLPGKRDTLLGESESVAVRSQRRYAKSRNLPWGVSESAFAVSDAEGNYQYRAFGIPDLGIRRGLADDQVIAPYASMLALGVWPEAAVRNLRTLASLGASGRYGFIDALDYTPGRVVSPDTYIKVRTWMAHHQGMSLVAIVNVLIRDRMPQRILREKSMQAIELLLQERIPWDAPTEQTRSDSVQQIDYTDSLPAVPNSWKPVLEPQLPQIQLLGNGRMSALVSIRGGGGLFYRNVSLTRWSPDATISGRGYRIHFADMESGAREWLGSTGYNPAENDASVVFSHHAVEMIRRVSGLLVRLEIGVAAHDDADIRRITLTNERNEPARVELTSFAEVALAPAADDARHPAFSKLFVGSQREEKQHGLSFARRPRDPDSKSPFLLHRVLMEEQGMELLAVETDRLRWLGRLGDSNAPAALISGLSNTTGWTLDPVMALQVGVLLQPGETCQLAFLTMAGESRQIVLERSSGFTLAELDRLFADTAMSAALELQQIGLDPAVLPTLQNLASLIIYPNPALRAASGGWSRETGNQADLWPFGLSGDLPVLLLCMDDESSSDLLDTLLRAQSLWRRRGLLLDLVVMRTGPASYEEPLRARIFDTLRDAGSYGWLGRDGGVHLLSVSSMSAKQIAALESCARVVLDADQSLADRLENVLVPRPQPPLLVPGGAMPDSVLNNLKRPKGLLFDNGVGGFDGWSGEYVIHLQPGETTPSPWCNVLANESFGSVVTEAGLGFSWGLNSGEHRLTTWSNDPVADTAGEMLYLRDEVSGDIWSVTPLPCTNNTAVQIRHGFGYTNWCRNSHGFEQELLTFVDVDDPVKILRLKLDNFSDQARRLTITCYVEWQLGAMADSARQHVVTQYDANCEAIVANNPWDAEFADRVAFMSASHSPHSVTGDRLDFLGSNGDIQRPIGLQRSDLGGAFTEGADSCGAWQIHLDIPASAATEVIFVLGEGGNLSEVAKLVADWRSGSRINDALSKLKDVWSHLTRAVQVQTPDAGFDLLVNHWLVYQNVSSRLLARAGYYQAGGAYGFRDQLQDVLALIPSDPSRVRRQILLAARYQFEAGDVLHWWHPPGGRGVRTHISDDRLWLALVTARYIQATDDWAILEVSIPFLQAPPLRDEEHDRYAGFEAGRCASLYEHCCRALECSMSVGAHGLPLIGTGDWNDGMDRVGRKGRGESVWLAWFQITVVTAMMSLAEYRGEADRALRWREYAAALKTAIDVHAWDGHWYLRAFDDEGLPWGSSSNDECQIDLIAQAWGAMAGFAKEERIVIALESARQRLIDGENRIVRLLTPPFHETVRNPGYIKAYPPGIRENGGQYTHAAAWLGLAFTHIGDGNTAYQIFDIINPISRTLDRKSVLRYAREPYVLAADVGGSDQNEGRGGWSWYTGAAGWTWQLAVHGILGIHYRPGGVRIEPCLPEAWDDVEILLGGPRGTISVNIANPEKVQRGIVEFIVDGVRQEDNEVDFPDGTDVTHVVVRLGKQD